MIGPDGIIAPWLEAIRPTRLLVVGDHLPILDDYQRAHPLELESAPANRHDLGHHPKTYAAVLISHVLASDDDLLLAGIARNQLAPQVLVFVRPDQVQSTALFGLGFVRHAETADRMGALLSFRYALATYNHTRDWNNPKFWANPERWNKHWW